MGHYMYDPTFDLARVESSEAAAEAMDSLENEAMVALPLWVVQSLANFVADLPHALPLAIAERAREAYGARALELLKEHLASYEEVNRGVFEF